MQLTPEMTHFIKCRRVDDRAWWFLTPGGGMNRLRIHAAQFRQDQADRVAAEIVAHNPGFEAKAVPIDRPVRSSR